jgi:leucine-zipper of insertion element IS481
VSRQTATRWWDRWRREGNLGLWDRSSRPHTSPTRTKRSAVAPADEALEATAIDFFDGYLKSVRSR